MITYGLNDADLEFARLKIENQKKYLSENEFITSNGQVKTLLDVSFSANHSYRYYSQLANKVNTLEQLAFNDNLVPNFLTMTLDGFYRDFLKGDYTRLIYMSKEKREEVFRSVPNNDTLGYILNKIQNLEVLSIKDLYKVLLFQNKNFFKSYAFKKLKKIGKKYMYIRTVEPHKDGVPHLHMMLFIPADTVSLFQKHFVNSFPAPHNAEPMRDHNNIPIEDTLVNFQTDINSASAYIMKYITKSFLDVKNGKELDYINAWYVKHRVMRCVTSRSTLPQWIYKKISILEKDWYYLTDILKSDNSDYTCEWSYENNYFYIYDNWSNREFEYVSGRLTLYVNGRISKRVGKVVEKPYKMISYEDVPKKWVKQVESIPVFVDDVQKAVLKKGVLHPYKTPIKYMKDLELYKYYESLDVDNEDIYYQHYLAVRNELINRKLLAGCVHDLNNFDMNVFFF